MQKRFAVLYLKWWQVLKFYFTNLYNLFTNCVGVRCVRKTRIFLAASGAKQDFHLKNYNENYFNLNHIFWFVST